MNGILQDFRYGFRMLSKNRAFAIVAVVILALGIGANSAIYSIVYNVLLKQLPYPEPEKLVVVWSTNKEDSNDRGPVSATDIADYRSQNSVLEEMSTIDEWRPILSGVGGQAERVPALQVGDGYFRIMKAEPLLGRLFLPQEQIEGKDFVVVLSHGLWRSRFGGDPNIIGKTIKLNLRAYTVIGVLKPEVQSLPASLTMAKVELYRPVAEPYDNEQRGGRHLYAIARLKKDVTLSKAQAELSTIATRLEKQYPDENTGRGIRLVTIEEDTIGEIRSSVLLLIGAAGLVLLIACANLANLLLARAFSRNREIAVRTSLGAPRWRLIRQLLAESAILTVAGGTIGIFLAYWSVDILRKIGTEVIPRVENIELNWQVLIFTFLISLAAGLLFGLTPAIQISKLDLNDALKDGGRSGTMGRKHGRMRNILIATEVALALLLLTGACLLVQSVIRLYQVNPGFNPSNLLTMSVWVPGAKYQDELKRTQFFNQIAQRIEQIPGVQAAGTTTVLPLSGGYDGRTITIDGQPRAASEEPSADMYVTTPDYLPAMKIPLIRGKYYTMQDTEKTQFVALVNETFAKQIWKREDPIGKRLRLYSSPTKETPWRTVVGIVKDVKNYGLDTVPPMQFYIPEAQFHSFYVSLVVRYDNIPLPHLIDQVRKQILLVDSDMPVFRIATMSELLNNSIAVRRLSMVLFGGFAFLAICLAISGIYGVVSFVTTQRTVEIGIRMTLGAQKKDVIHLIVHQGMVPALIGSASGLLGAIALTRLMTKLLFDTPSFNPVTFITVTLVIIITAAVACFIPARRASKLDPLVSLRYE
jgi:putative ABC transport system permease protein